MATIRAVAVGVIMIGVACSGGDEDADAGTERAVEAAEVVLALADAGLPVELTVVYTEETDPNDLLGRPGGYASKAAFVDSRIDLEEVVDTSGGSVELGGGVEVFGHADDAEERADYIQSITEGGILAEYDIVEGPVLLRLSQQLTPTQAEEISGSVDGGSDGRASRRHEPDDHRAGEHHHDDGDPAGGHACEPVPPGHAGG